MSLAEATVTGIVAKTAFDPWPYIMAGAVFIGVLAVLGSIVVPWVRKRYHPSSGAGRGGAPMDIEFLERSRRDGLMTDEEFRRLRRIAMGLDTKPAKQDNSASSAPGGRDDEETDAPPGEGSAPALGDNEDRPQEE